MGGFVRIFTSYQETGDVVLYGGYILTSIINFTLVAQILIYQSNTKEILKKEKKMD